jgi:hypothetical protein
MAKPFTGFLYGIKHSPGCSNIVFRDVIAKFLQVCDGQWRELDVHLLCCRQSGPDCTQGFGSRNSFASVELLCTVLEQPT